MQDPVICRYWVAGKCKRGNQCKWTHGGSVNMFSYISTSPISNSPLMNRMNDWKPKTPINTVNMPTITKHIDNRSVIIKGKWADVEDTDYFFNEYK